MAAMFLMLRSFPPQLLLHHLTQVQLLPKQPEGRYCEHSLLNDSQPH